VPNNVVESHDKACNRHAAHTGSGIKSTITPNKISVTRKL